MTMTGFEEKTLDDLANTAIAIAAKPVEDAASANMQTLARTVAELANRLKRMEEGQSGA